MSCYELSRLLFDLKMKESVYEQALTDFEAVTTNYELTAEEKTALREGDPRKLRQLGCTGCFVFTSNGCSQNFVTISTGNRSNYTDDLIVT